MIKLIDNLVPASFANKLEQVFMDDDTPWNLAVSCGGYSNISNIDQTMVKDTSQMYHSIISENINKSVSSNLVMGILFFLEDKAGITAGFISRAKANLLLPMCSDPNLYHPPHVDVTMSNYLSMVYYVNDSDGPTRFFDSDGNIIQTVHPKKGRAVLFDSNIPHASSCPINSKHRMVINFVFMKA